MTIESTTPKNELDEFEPKLALPQPRRCVSPQGAALYLGLRSVRALDQLEDPPQFIRISKRVRVFDLADLDQWLDQHPRIDPRMGVLHSDPR